MTNSCEAYSTSGAPDHTHYKSRLATMLLFSTVTMFLLMSLSLSIPVRELEIEITPSSAMSAALHTDSPSYRAHVLFYKSNGNSLM